MLTAESRVLITNSLQNPLTAEGALYMLLKDHLPSDFDFAGAIKKLNFSDLGYKQLSSMMSVQGLPAVVDELENRLGLSFEEVRGEAQSLNDAVDRVSQAVAKWKASRPEYHQTVHNKKMLLAFIEDPEQFGYYTSKDGIIRYSLDGSTPASKLATAEKNLAHLQSVGFQSKTGRARFEAAKAEVDRLRSEAVISRANTNQEITIKNLEIAYVALMAAGKLEEKSIAPSTKPLVGQQDPTTLADGDGLPRKKVANMSSAEYQEHINRSPKFREKMNETNPANPIQTASSVRVLTDEKKRELLAEINRMPSHVYDKWLQDPANAAVVNELYI
jgi:hypothetical protein